MIKNEILIGFLIGLLANFIGLILAILIFTEGAAIDVVIKQAIAEGFFTKLVSIGAVLNLIVFFVFIKKKQDYRARGVLLATVLVAISTFFINIS
ncbi:hypothetical protein OE09_0522 [Flavobacteriaceae bacterium MAR_2010_72]|nr:hypothetical protein OE09_0522 [Flavobacteriaceae bacterium MAR_2010_72]TVZ57827.1 hypothetical protein NA63_0316 [Flavobacteriaceae bacterium MAR_2010_105]